MSAKRKMPKNKAEYQEALKLAFRAGCNWGYGVEHDGDLDFQENLGAMAYVGEITEDDAINRMLAYQNSL